MRVDLVDPSAYTLPYDHALAAALARAGISVRLITSDFAYGAAPEPAGYEHRRDFYRHARGPAGSRRRMLLKLAEHGPDMLALRRLTSATDVVHFQWLAVPPLDALLLPVRPTVLTAHDLLPREPRPGQLRAHRRLLERVDAVIVHSAYGRRKLIAELDLDPARIEVIPHGVFDHLARTAPAAELPPELPDTARPVVLCFGLIRPYKGLDILLDAWRGIAGAELWIVGRPRMDISQLRRGAPPGVRFVPRFVPDPVLATIFRRADLVVVPYVRTDRFDQSGVLATALAFGKPTVVSDIGGLAEVAALGAARAVPPGDVEALRGCLSDLLGDEAALGALSRAAADAARGPLSWDAVARTTRELYARILRA